ncbi:MAG: YeeE/YedE family protein [Gammaproteobacteria bacterium]|nr:YeeE/YedE family protein [Gammaproteobacteria bacterium]
MEYWSWWIGALALGIFAVIFSLFTGKPLGVSGSWLSIARRKDDAILKASAEVLQGDQTQVKDDLMAMTMAEFGEDFVADNLDTNQQRRAGETNAVSTSDSKLKQDYTPWTVHVLFLATMFLGSYIASITTGEFSLSTELSALHAKIFENTGEAWIALLFGGMMVGFGTQMAGGCTSGHGLSGTAQLIPASIVSTIVFFGSATALTFFMNMML